MYDLQQCVPLALLEHVAASCATLIRRWVSLCVVPALVFGSDHAEPQPLNSNLGACTFVQPAPDAGIHDYRHCLRDRRIFVGGNSIARNLASAMAKLLSSDSAASLVARMPVPHAMKRRLDAAEAPLAVLTTLQRAYSMSAGTRPSRSDGSGASTPKHSGSALLSCSPT